MARGAPDYAASRIVARAKLGYDDVIEDYQTMIGTGGVDDIPFGPVPANKIWNITSAMMWNMDGATVMETFSTFPGGLLRHPFAHSGNVPQNQTVGLVGQVWLEAGDYLQARFVIAGIGDTLYAALHGTQIDVEI